MNEFIMLNFKERAVYIHINWPKLLNMAIEQEVLPFDIFMKACEEAYNADRYRYLKEFEADPTRGFAGLPPKED